MDTTSAVASADGVPNYGAMLSRRKWLILGCTLLGLALAIVYTLTTSKTYTATTSVLVKPTGPAVVPSNATSSVVAKTGINLDTEAQLVKSQSVSTAAGQLLKSPLTWRKLAENVTVTVPPNTTVLDISYDAGRAKGAAAGAQAVATAYLKYRVADADRSAKLARSVVQQQINQLLVQLQTTTAKIASLPTNSPDRALAQANQSALVSQISTQQGQLAQLAAPSNDVGSIVSAAAIPGKASTPVLPLDLASGLMLGLLVGLALALFRDRADHRIRRGGDIEPAVGLPVLAELGSAKRRRAATAVSDGYQQLRNVLLTSSHARSQVVLVAPASDGPFGGTVAVNIAASLIRAGKRVVLVTTTSGSTAVKSLGLDDASAGITDVVHGNADLADVLQHSTVLPGLQIVGTGRGVGAEIVATAAFEAVINRLRQIADVVVLEGASVAESADAQAIAPVADAVVLVAQVKRTTRDQLAQARHQMDLVGTHVLGVVLVHTSTPPIATAVEGVTPGSTALEPVGSTVER
jgi:capsular polysaccharide biosynthesis protein/Mrp family chromosome partitioning ATPase